MIKLNLKVRRLPDIYEVRGGRVTGKAASGFGVTNFENLVVTGEESDAARFAGPEPSA